MRAIILSLIVIGTLIVKVFTLSVPILFSVYGALVIIGGMKYGGLLGISWSIFGALLMLIGAVQLSYFGEESK